MPRVRWATITFTPTTYKRVPIFLKLLWDLFDRVMGSSSDVLTLKERKSEDFQKKSAKTWRLGRQIRRFPKNVSNKKQIICLVQVFSALLLLSIVFFRWFFYRGDDNEQPFWVCFTQIKQELPPGFPQKWDLTQFHNSANINTVCFYIYYFIRKGIVWKF